MTKLCVDCTFYRPCEDFPRDPEFARRFATCGHPNATRTKPDPVTGEPSTEAAGALTYCSVHRKGDWLDAFFSAITGKFCCGPQGRWFKRREA